MWVPMGSHSSVVRVSNPGLDSGYLQLKGPESEWSNPENLKFYFMKPHCSRVDMTFSMTEWGFRHLPESCGMLISDN